MISLSSLILIILGSTVFYLSFINYDKSEILIFLFFLFSSQTILSGIGLGAVFILLKLLCDEFCPEFYRAGFAQSVFNYNQMVVDLLDRYGVKL